MFSLKDRVALVTGASQGIGRATALALAAAGAKVAVAARNAEKLAALARKLNAAGGEALAVPMDVADAEQVKAGFQQVSAQFGRLDILVNNAAITREAGAAHEARRLGRSDAHQSDRGASLHPAGAGDDDAAALRADYQCDFGGGGDGQCGPGELRGGESGADRIDAGDRDGNGFAQYYGECVAPGFIATPMTEALPQKVKEAMMARIPLGAHGHGRAMWPRRLCFWRATRPATSPATCWT